MMEVISRIDRQDREISALEEKVAALEEKLGMCFTHLQLQTEAAILAIADLKGEDVDQWMEALTEALLPNLEKIEEISKSSGGL